MKAKELKPGDYAIIGFVIGRIESVRNLSGGVTMLCLYGIIIPITIPSILEVLLCDELGKPIQEMPRV